MNREPTPPVSTPKGKYRKTTLRVYGTVGELTASRSTKGMDDGKAASMTPQTKTAA